MPDIFISNRKIESVFELLGNKEDDISYSVGWALSKSDSFLKIFLIEALKKYIDIKKIDLDKVIIHLQKIENKKGRTDFEIHQPGFFFLIIEAKRGWVLPEEAQLKQYCQRRQMTENLEEIKKIFVVSECSNEYVSACLPYKEIEGIEVLHFSWQNLFSFATKAIANGSHAEKRLLTELKVYFKKIMTMQRLDSNWVWVVPVGGNNPDGWKISWRNIVYEKNSYFHPVGNRYPKVPPNYIAFRFDGMLQSIHFIKDYKVTNNLSDYFAEAPKMKDHPPHYIYTLDKAIPAKKIPSGKIIWTTRVSCMLDTLLTYPTIGDAYDETNRRYKIIQSN